MSARGQTSSCSTFSFFFLPSTASRAVYCRVTDSGELISKWSPRDVPEKERLRDLLDREPVSVSTDFIVSRRIKAQGFTVYLLALLLLL